jgi:hypothetical protein
VRLRRYRVNVLDLSAFPLHESFVLSKPLIDLLGATLERTQVSFEGFATSLHMCSPDSPSIDRQTLEGAFLQTELLRMQRDSSVCISTPDELQATHHEHFHVSASRAIERDLPALRSAFRKVWAQEHEQRCPRRGYCKLLVVDGNAKICRDTCASRHRFYQHLPGYGWVHDGCTKSPAVGERLCVECMETSAERSEPLEVRNR